MIKIMNPGGKRSLAFKKMLVIQGRLNSFGQMREKNRQMEVTFGFNRSNNIR
jgi:hypothetical protein